MRRHIADLTAPKPKPHHFMTADGFCHAGDVMAHGTPFIALYAAEELVRVVNTEKAEAWWQGHCDVCSDCNCPATRSPYFTLEGI